jgi:hypothetical protein
VSQADLAPRSAALDLLAAALDRRSGLEDAMTTGAFARLNPLDRSFARASSWRRSGGSAPSTGRCRGE